MAVVSSVDVNQAKMYRDRIEQMLKTVPPSVASGSYQKSVAFKDAVDKAQKALKSPNSVLKLSAACNTLSMFY